MSPASVHLLGRKRECNRSIELSERLSVHDPLSSLCLDFHCAADLQQNHSTAQKRFSELFLHSEAYRPLHNEPSY